MNMYVSIGVVGGCGLYECVCTCECVCMFPNKVSD